MKLYHFSEDPGIQIFHPRIMYNRTNEPAMVWSIDAFHAPHYYFPRECPRICIWPKADTHPQDLNKFLGMSGTTRMVAIEADWYDRVSRGHIFRYIFASEPFELYEPNAGYYISTSPVKPEKVEKIDNLIQAILREGIELRILPSLEPLKESILDSSIQFSMIRMRNAGQP